MVLTYLGIDPNTAGAADYDKMVEAFAPIRHYIATFDNANYLNALPNGELCVGQQLVGRLWRRQAARPRKPGSRSNLAYFVPKTGAPAWFDVWAIPADAPNVDNAYAFLDFMLRPEVIAACTNYTGYANANKAATPLVDPAIAGRPGDLSRCRDHERGFTRLTPADEEQDEAMTRAWTEIKTGG